MGSSMKNRSASSAVDHGSTSRIVEGELPNPVEVHGDPRGSVPREHDLHPRLGLDRREGVVLLRIEGQAPVQVVQPVVRLHLEVDQLAKAVDVIEAEHELDRVRAASDGRVRRSHHEPAASGEAQHGAPERCVVREAARAVAELGEIGDGADRARERSFEPVVRSEGFPHRLRLGPDRHLGRRPGCTRAETGLRRWDDRHGVRRGRGRRGGGEPRDLFGAAERGRWIRRHAVQEREGDARRRHDEGQQDHHPPSPGGRAHGREGALVVRGRSDGRAAGRVARRLGSGGDRHDIARLRGLGAAHPIERRTARGTGGSRHLARPVTPEADPLARGRARR